MSPVFNVGDTVFLKGGGPRMTVKRVEDTTVTCVWFLPHPSIGSDPYMSPYTTIASYDFHAQMLLHASTPLGPKD